MLRNRHSGEFREIDDCADHAALGAQRAGPRIVCPKYAVAKRDRLRAEARDRDFDLGHVAEPERRFEVTLGAHCWKADAIAIDDLRVCLGSDARSPQLLERDVKVME